MNRPLKIEPMSVGRIPEIDPEAADRTRRHVLRRFERGDETAADTLTILQALGLVDYEPDKHRRWR